MLGSLPFVPTFQPQPRDQGIIETCNLELYDSQGKKNWSSDWWESEKLGQVWWRSRVASWRMEDIDAQAYMVVKPLHPRLNKEVLSHLCLLCTDHSQFQGAGVNKVSWQSSIQPSVYQGTLATACFCVFLSASEGRKGARQNLSTKTSVKDLHCTSLSPALTYLFQSPILTPIAHTLFPVYGRYIEPQTMSMLWFK